MNYYGVEKGILTLMVWRSNMARFLPYYF